MSRASSESYEWLQHAQNLRDGGRVRVPHDCGEGDALLISRKGNEVSAYCFRCGPQGIHREHESLAERAVRIHQEQRSDDRARASVDLPEPRVYDTREWPLAAKMYFYRMGLTLGMIGELGLYWCPPLGRVVLPVCRGDRAVYWTARSHTRAPKWLTPTVPKKGMTARYGEGKGSCIVLTEDPLSAYKVGLVTEAWSLLGTKLHDKTALQLMRTGKPVCVWLDDDRGRGNGKNPGQIAARRIAARLRALGIETRNVTSPRDPKYYTREYIKEALST